MMIQGDISLPLLGSDPVTPDLQPLTRPEPDGLSITSSVHTWKAVMLQTISLPTNQWYQISGKPDVDWGSLQLEIIPVSVRQVHCKTPPSIDLDLGLSTLLTTLTGRWGRREYLIIHELIACTINNRGEMIYFSQPCYDKIHDTFFSASKQADTLTQINYLLLV